MKTGRGSKYRIRGDKTRKRKGSKRQIWKEKRVE